MERNVEEIFPSMKLYNALIKKNKEGKIEDIILLKEGFSCAAFIFSSFWFLYNKMWKESLVLMATSIFFTVFCASGSLSGFDETMLEISLLLIIALNANFWLAEDLKKRGYEFVGLVFGSDRVNAKMRFIKSLEGELDDIEFDDAIMNPKLHRKMMKLKKQEPYFTV